MRPTSGLGHWAILWEAAVGSSEPEVCAALRWWLLVQQARFCPVPKRGGRGQGGRELGYSNCNWVFKWLWTLAGWKRGWELSPCSNFNVVASPGEGICLQKGPT